MRAHIVCPRHCRLVRFLLWAPRWLAGGVCITHVRVGTDCHTWVRVEWR